MHLKMDGNDDDVVGKQVNTSSPPLQSGITIFDQRRIKESIESVDLVVRSQKERERFI